MMVDSLLTTFANKHLPKLDQEINQFIKEHATEDSLLASMNYSLAAGGKKLRPLLLLATIDFFNGQITKGAYQVAGALEMIHTYSLIHDDLPAMDDDELRRGKPTNHIVFGEGLAILAGDGLLTEAFHLVAEAELAADLKVALLQRLAVGAGTQGMIGGQVADIEGESRQLDLACLQSVHRRKTGALIKFAVEAGLMLSGQEQQLVELMLIYADNFGIAFQIKDDLLDVIGDEAVIGKKTGMDQVLNKSTYTSLLGIEGAEKALEEHCQLALSILAEVKSKLRIDQKTSLLEELIQTLMV